MAALIRANEEHAVGYGVDPWTVSAKELFRALFGETSDTAFVFSGSGGNSIGLSALVTKPYGAVVCAERAHLSVHECGAPEKMVGCKLILVPTGPDYKLTPDLILPRLPVKGDVHECQPMVLSLTNATESGAVYTAEELRALAAFAHSLGWRVHLDGARLANAAVHLGETLYSITGGVGIDIATIGGTKNGLMYGEAVVVFDRELHEDLPFLQKQAGQMASKMRFLAAQFNALFGSGLWMRNAAQANHLAYLLKGQMDRIGVPVTRPVQTNAVFVTLERQVADRLLEDTFFYPWDTASNEYRFMCAFDHTAEEVMAFAKRIHAALQ